MASQRSELARTTLAVLSIGALIAGSLWILSPFLAAFIWATMIVVATWPLMRRVESAFGGRRAPAVAMMTLGLLAILIVPLAIALQAILEYADDLVVRAKPYAGAVATWFGQQAGSFALVLVQSVLGGIGLAIAGVPFAGPLTAVMFALCIAQLGPILVLLFATAWAFYSLGAGWGGLPARVVACGRSHG